jgi:hypothetical protein
MDAPRTRWRAARPLQEGAWTKGEVGPTHGRFREYAPRALAGLARNAPPAEPLAPRLPTGTRWKAAGAARDRCVAWGAARTTDVARNGPCAYHRAVPQCCVGLPDGSGVFFPPCLKRSGPSFFTARFACGCRKPRVIGPDIFFAPKPRNVGAARNLIRPSRFRPGGSGQHGWLSMTPDDFRQLALSQPGAKEVFRRGDSAFRVLRKTFASLEGPVAKVRLTSEQQSMFIHAAPRTFAPVPGGWGWLGACACQRSDR